MVLIYDDVCFLNIQPVGWMPPSISLIQDGFWLSRLDIQTFIMQKFFLGEIVIPVILGLNFLSSVNTSPIKLYYNFFQTLETHLLLIL